MLAKARHLSPNIDFKLSNGCAIKFNNESFDLVTQHVVFSSIASAGLREELAREMMRVLRPGGFIYWWDMLGMAYDAGGSAQLLSAPPLPKTAIKNNQGRIESAAQRKLPPFAGNHRASAPVDRPARLFPHPSRRALRTETHFMSNV